MMGRKLRGMTRRSASSRTKAGVGFGEDHRHLEHAVTHGGDQRASWVIVFIPTSNMVTSNTVTSNTTRCLLQVVSRMPKPHSPQTATLCRLLATYP